MIAAYDCSTGLICLAFALRTQYCHLAALIIAASLLSIPSPTHAALMAGAQIFVDTASSSQLGVSSASVEIDRRLPTQFGLIEGSGAASAQSASTDGFLRASISVATTTVNRQIHSGAQAVYQDVIQVAGGLLPTIRLTIGVDLTVSESDNGRGGGSALTELFLHNSFLGDDVSFSTVLSNWSTHARVSMRSDEGIDTFAFPGVWSAYTFASDASIPNIVHFHGERTIDVPFTNPVMK